MTNNVQPRYVQTVVTVPAGTALISPLAQSFALGVVVVDRIEVMIPPGHAGLTGLAILYGGVPLVPWQTGNVPLTSLADFLVGDDKDWQFSVGFQISGPLQIRAFNTDVYDHSFYLRAEVRDVAAIAQPANTVVAVTVSAQPDTSTPSQSQLLDAAAPPELPAEGEELPASLTDTGALL